jgi:hypothetical protein
MVHNFPWKFGIQIILTITIFFNWFWEVWKLQFKNYLRKIESFFLISFMIMLWIIQRLFKMRFQVQTNLCAFWQFNWVWKFYFIYWINFSSRYYSFQMEAPGNFTFLMLQYPNFLCNLQGLLTMKLIKTATEICIFQFFIQKKSFLENSFTKEYKKKFAIVCLFD